MTRNARVALILTTQEKSREANVVLSKTLMLYKKHFRRNTFTWGVQHKLPNSLYLITIKDIFKHYNFFDNFLLELTEKGFCNMNKLGIVIGHNDNSGFFWVDYSPIEICYNFKCLSNVDGFCADYEGFDSYQNPRKKEGYKE